jgi:hypothetical protein
LPAVLEYGEEELREDRTAEERALCMMAKITGSGMEMEERKEDTIQALTAIRISKESGRNMRLHSQNFEKLD